MQRLIQKHSRRGFIRSFVLGGLGASAVSTRLQSAPALDSLNPRDDAFLEDIQRTTFQYFWECTDPATGLVKDRNRVRGEDNRIVASIAATGFGLTALCIADARGWRASAPIRERVRASLRFLCRQMPQERGFFYHFVHWRTGERQWKCELSTIDTALLLAGVLTCRQHFQADAEIRRLAADIYDRVEWDWMLQGEKTLLHGWTPERGFLAHRWSTYCEHMILYLLAIGANVPSIPAGCWEAWKRPTVTYGGYRFISDGAPLFVHQYSHAWFDFRSRRDRHADYFENSVVATRAHRQFCVDLQPEFETYGEGLWGVTASDSPKGYVAWGGPPRRGPIDGTVVPCAAGGSLPFLPNECLQCLRTIRQRFGDLSWTRFGFIDSFNPRTKWTASDVLGIDAGITLLMAENLRTGFVWKTFMQNPEAQRAMRRVGFT